MVISTDYQSEGVGQFGSKWESEAGQNCTFSWIIYPPMIEVKSIFLLHMMVTLAVWDSIHTLYPHLVLKIKWPNDIFVDQHKVGGILIQTGIKGHKLDFAVIGIGLNLNQNHFADTLPRAASLFQKSGKQLTPTEVIEMIVSHLHRYYDQIRTSPVSDSLYDQWQNSYHQKLFAYQRPYKFYPVHGTPFTGVIQGVDKDGHLLIEKEDHQIHRFEHKSISFFND